MRSPKTLGSLASGRVAVAADAVAVLAAQHLVDRHVVGLARQIPERLFDRHHAAGLAADAAELLDLLENLLDIAGILPKNAALEEQSIGLAGAVPDFAVARDALVGVDADDGARERSPGKHRDAQIGDPQLRRFGISVDVLRESFEQRVGPERVRQELQPFRPGIGAA